MRRLMEIYQSEKMISVIVPVYNTRKYLSRCIDALLAQSISNMEIIVIDDCSDEEIKDVIDAYIGKSDKMIYYERLEQHQGPGGARNRGIELATGKYLAFCDSDDWVDITYYETCVNLMDRYETTLGMCSLVRVYDYVQEKPLYKCKYDRELLLTGDYAIKVLTKQIDVGLSIIPSTVNKVYRRDYLGAIQLSFIKDKLFEDLLFSFISIMNAKKILCVPKVNYHHYKRPNSIVQSYDKKHIDDFIDIFSMLRDYLKSTGQYEKYCYHYYKFLEQFYNLVVREIFEFVPDEKEQKAQLAYSFHKIKAIIDFDEYIEYTTAEQLRQHIQPHITDTTIY